MRRLVATAALTLLAVMATPVPADAYFWKWIDDLSGPKFGGIVGELQFKCWPVNVSHSLKSLDAIGDKIEKDRSRYVAAESDWSGTPAAAFAATAHRYSDLSLAWLSAVRTAVSEAEIRADEARRKGDEVADKPKVANGLLHALAWQARAEQHFAWAQGLHVGQDMDPRMEPGKFKETIDTMAEPMSVLGVGGVRYSICKYQALDRDRFFASAQVGFGVDFKNNDDHSPGRHLLLTTGGSVHWAPTSWLNLGAGGGLAVFLTSGSVTMMKGYIQPSIVDIKPAAMVRRANVRSPWRQLVYVRYSTLTFPGGFQAGDFSRNSPAYPTELINQLGIHFDLTPVLRGRKGNW